MAFKLPHGLDREAYRAEVVGRGKITVASDNELTRLERKVDRNTGIMAMVVV
jgi:hypothetical protein